MSTNSQADMPEQPLSPADNNAAIGALTKDGVPLKRSLARALRREKFRALMLIMPLLAFVVVSFIFPIGDMLFRSVENKIVQDTIPGTVKALAAWDASSGELPDESVYATVADDLMLAQELKRHTRLGSRLNYDQPGISSVFRKTGRRIKRFDNTATMDALIKLNPVWESPDAWTTLRKLDGFSQTFPSTAQSWRNWTNYVASEEGKEADPTATVPYGFTYTMLYHDLKRLDPGQIKSLESDAGDLFAGIGGVIEDMSSDNFKEQFAKIDKGWIDIENWQAIKRLSPPVVDSYFLASIDAERTAAGIERKPDNERIYITLFVRTVFMSLVITISCILLGYPIAFLLAHLSVRASNLVLILVLIPFWTSLLVRTSAWKVLLQQQGVINDLLIWIGLISDTGRLVLINNMTGTIIAMTHILLPFMILPLFSVMKTISPTYMRAAKSMGASDSLAFWRIYFPNTIPGIGAGSILVFILAIGYYITPELVGGTKGVFISNRIAYHISSSLNWGLAAALGSILLVLVLALYWAYDRVVGIDNVKLG
ncbi:MAG: ABC transporter permease [Granulosicoccus sp.]